MSNLNVQIPESLYKQIETLAEKAKRGSWDKFQQVLVKVPDVQPEDDDKLSWKVSFAKLNVQ
ncbi:hypothetical protein [Nodularia sp. UHCC 0506]|uniref:hypothetical protein n=1 Tax=Nodularia sp. UHCC 0506 TaxID=3110243 RepID=UPI002B21C81C|nr:hypothetical protein [Nodularia sp. UHCC 0506]MEA5515009.1 hypothetical protein [Nodularia sp. UHCC 0506]